MRYNIAIPLKIAKYLSIRRKPLREVIAMSLSLAELQAVSEIATLIYNFLPGTPHPYADPRISFAGVAKDIGLYGFWRGGSKLPAINMLLKMTLETRRDLFCRLILEIVHRGLIYRNNKGNPITREEIKKLNELIIRVRFKIPELWDPTFLDSLPSAKAKEEKKEQINQAGLDMLKKEFLELEKIETNKRGFVFEKFLKTLFAYFGLEPKNSFRLTGEQIDGSLEIDGNTYLVEAKWHRKPVGNAELLTFYGKVEGKSKWSRGLFISYGGFTPEGLEAFSRGRSTNIIAMTGEDIYFILHEKISLIDVIRLKARHAAETGQILIKVQELAWRGYIKRL